MVREKTAYRSIASSWAGSWRDRLYLVICFCSSGEISNGFLNIYLNNSNYVVLRLPGWMFNEYPNIDNT